MRLLQLLTSKFSSKKKVNKTFYFSALLILLIFIQILLILPDEVDTEGVRKAKSDQTTETLSSQSSEPEKHAVEQKLVGFHLVENANNEKAWKLFAEEASGSSDTQWILKKVNIEIFNEGELTYKIHGAIGQIDAVTKDIQLKGDVITESENGYSFKTDDLSYESDNKFLVTDNNVQMQGPSDTRGNGFNLNGQGFKVDVRTGKMYILKNVKANKEFDKKKFNLVSDSAEFSNKTKEAEFIGQVKMKYDQADIVSPEAVFKYNDKQSVLQYVTLKDDVHFVERTKDGQRKGSSAVMIIDLLQDKVTMQGQPKVQMGSDVIEGEEIIFLDGGKKVKINQASVQGTNSGK